MKGAPFWIYLSHSEPLLVYSPETLFDLFIICFSIFLILSRRFGNSGWFKFIKIWLIQKRFLILVSHYAFASIVSQDLGSEGAQPPKRDMNGERVKKLFFSLKNAHIIYYFRLNSYKSRGLTPKWLGII